MSHTLHRRGSAESLENDIMVFAMTAKGFNEKGSKEALKEFLRIVIKHKPVNFGDMKTGNRFIMDDEMDIVDRTEDTSIVQSVFTDKETVKKVIRELKEADLGVSVVVTGIVDNVHKICTDVGIDRHTVEYSLGIRGKLTKLPEEEILEITTMCGHGMVSQNLAKQMLIDIKKGRRTPAEAGQYLATPCVCGVFNPARAEQLLEQLLEVWCIDEV